MLDQIKSIVQQSSDKIISLAQDLVRIESENHPPYGNEAGVQDYIAGFWRSHSINCDYFMPTEVPDFRSHPAYFDNGRVYDNRPVVVAKIAGEGGGRSLLFSGHIDVVPLGKDTWKHDPYGGEIEDGKLFGRGAFDMKGGAAAMMMAANLLKENDIKLNWDLLIETTPDEEFASSNGTVAARARGYCADAAVITEPTNMAIVTGQRGFRMAQVAISGDIVGISIYDGEMINPVHHLAPVLQGIEKYRKRRLPVTGEDTVMITKLGANEFKPDELFASPRECRIEVYWQVMPEEDIFELDTFFEETIKDACESDPFYKKYPPQFSYHHRPMPGSRVSADAGIVRESTSVMEEVTGKPANIVKGFVPCDLFVFNKYCGMPAVVMGPTGDNAHAPDEYVELDSVIKCVEVYMKLAVNWCGVIS